VEGPDGDWYSVCVESLSWTEASAHCQSRGQELLSLHDDDTAEFVFSTGMELFDWRPFWIGLNDRDTEGVFTWSDGSDFDYSRWCTEAPMPPPEGDSRDCVQFFDLQWRDVDCGEPMQFVCH